MIDLYLKASTENDMITALIKAHIIDDDGNPMQGFSVDHVGSFTKVIDCDAQGKSVEKYYPEWHTNLRGSFDERQLALLTDFSVEPSFPYRVWA